MAGIPWNRRLTLTSTDGIPIVTGVIGQGHPLVIVPGSLSISEDWRDVALPLADDFEVFVINRRGRRPSGDSEDYDIGREVADVGLVMAAAGPDAALFGHSFGGALALSYAVDAPPRALALYEPSIGLDEPIGGTAVSRVEDAINGGDRDRALALGMELFVGRSTEDVDAAKASPAWPLRASLVHTWPREIAGLNTLDLSPARFARVSCPTLLLRGTESPHWLRETTARLQYSVPETHLVDLLGQSHDAHSSAPEMVANALRTGLSRQPAT